MMTASYLYNRIPHSSLKMETPYKTIHGKDADLSYLRIMDAGAFVHVKDANKLGHTPWRRNGMQLQPEREQLISYLQPRDASSWRKQERRLHRNTTALAPPFQADFAATGSGSSNV